MSNTLKINKRPIEDVSDDDTVANQPPPDANQKETTNLASQPQQDHNNDAAVSNPESKSDDYAISKPFAVVTGASSGIGKAVSINLIKNGFNVALLARSEDKLNQIVKEYQTDDNNLIAIKCDATDPSQIISACKQIKTWSKDKINLLLNNVGGASFNENLENTTLTQWDKSINLNLRSAFLFTQQLLFSLKNASKSPIKYGDNIYDGAVINISSALSTDATSHQVSIGYSIAKAGLEQLTRINAHELGKYKVRVNALKLGSIPSGAMDKWGEEKEKIDAMFKLFEPVHAIGRNGSFHDVSEMVKFMAQNNKSGWITGAIIDLNGGWTLHGAGSTGVWTTMQQK